MRQSVVGGRPGSAWVAMPALALLVFAPAMGAERADGNETALQARAERPSKAAGEVPYAAVSSELTWQLFGAIRYDLNDQWALLAGWRQYSIDYKNDGFIFGVSMGGPVLAATYRF